MYREKKRNEADAQRGEERNGGEWALRGLSSFSNFFLSLVSVRFHITLTKYPFPLLTSFNSNWVSQTPNWAPTSRVSKWTCVWEWMCYVYLNNVKLWAGFISTYYMLHRRSFAALYKRWSCYSTEWAGVSVWGVLCIVRCFLPYSDAGLWQ